MVKSPFWMYLTFHAVARRISPRKKILRSGSQASKGFHPLLDPMKSWYWTTALYLKELELINVLPLQLKRHFTIYNNDQDLAEAFMENHAVFHKSFISVYNKLKLNQKRKHAESSNVRDASENSLESDLVEVRFTKFHSKLFLLWRMRLWRKAS